MVKRMLTTVLLCVLAVMLLGCSKDKSKEDADATAETAEDSSDKLFPVVRNGKWGYIDKAGKIVIEPQFDEGMSFSEGLAWVKVGGKVGFINKTGKMVIKPQFYDGGTFSEGLAPVKVSGQWGYGYINKAGNWVIQPQFDDAESFSGGLARVKTGGKLGFIDKTGKIVIEPQFGEVGTFSEGLARVKVGRESPALGTIEGTITGTSVTRGINTIKIRLRRDKLSGATITVQNGSGVRRTTETDDTGHYVIHIPPGEYVVTVSKVGYEDSKDYVSIGSNSLLTLDVTLFSS